MALWEYLERELTEIFSPHFHPPHKPSIKHYDKNMTDEIICNAR